MTNQPPPDFNAQIELAKERNRVAADRTLLADGEVFDWKPTGAHEEAAAVITAKLCVQIDRISFP